MPSISMAYCLPGKGLDEYIDEFVAAAAGAPFTTWLFLPTERLVQSIQQKLTRRNIPFIPSRICTLNGFCSFYFEENRKNTRYLTKSESKMLLMQILDDNRDQAPMFFTRGHPSSKTVDELHTFIDVIISRKVVFPECLLDLQGRKSEQIDVIISEYRRYLHEHDLIDTITCPEWTTARLRKNGTELLGLVFMYGIFKPLPLERELLGLICSNAETVSCSIPTGSDPDIFGGSEKWIGRAENPEVLQVTSSGLRSELTGLFSKSGPIESGEFIRLGTYPTHFAELQGIAGEICRLHSSGVPLSDIFVAFPEIKDELGIVGEVFSDYGIPWNAGVALPLSREPVIQFLLSIPGIVANRYAREDVVRFIGSPYYPAGKNRKDSRSANADEVDLVSRYAQIEGDRREWQERLERLLESAGNPEHKKHGIDQGSVRRTQDRIQGLFDDLKRLEGKKSVRDFLLVYNRILESYRSYLLPSHPDETIYEKEISAVDNFFARLRNLSGAQWLSDEKIGAGEFLRLLTALFREEEGSRRKDSGGVTLLGIRECSHQQFPYLFIGGMVEGAIPSLTTRLPFTNSLENIRMGTRSLADILHEQEYYFITALLSARERVSLSAPLTDGENPLLTSAFFERVKEKCKSADAGVTDLSVFSRSASGIHGGELIDDAKICQALEYIDGSRSIDDLVERVNIERYYRTGFCDSLYDGVLSGDDRIVGVLAERYGPSHVYSPTSLEVYAECPFHYFLGKVIGLLDLPEVEPNLSPGDRGTVVHDILSGFYRQWRTSGHTKVTPLLLEEATGLILKIVGEELERQPFRSPLWAATCNQMLGCSHTGPGYFERFLAEEAEESDSPLVPTFFEFSFGTEKSGSDDPSSVGEAVDLPSSDNREHIRIRGRIDRVDISPDGYFVIYDYKTGSQHPRFRDIEEGRALQLSLYLLAFEKASGKRGVAAGYYKIRRDVDVRILLCNEIGKSLMASRPRISPDFQGIIGQSRDFALEYIHKIRSGGFPLPHEEKCPNAYCEFKRVCRFDPYRIFACDGVA